LRLPIAPWRHHEELFHTVPAARKSKLIAGGSGAIDLLIGFFPYRINIQFKSKSGTETQDSNQRTLGRVAPNHAWLF